MCIPYLYEEYMFRKSVPRACDFIFFVLAAIQRRPFRILEVIHRLRRHREIVQNRLRIFQQMIIKYKLNKKKKILVPCTSFFIGIIAVGS